MKTNPLTSLLNNLRQTLRRLLCAHCLGIRAFDGNTRREVYERQQGICPACGRHFEIEEMDADHITPCSKGGRTIASNCQMLCKECNRRKSNKKKGGLLECLLSSGDDMCCVLRSRDGP